MDQGFGARLRAQRERQHVTLNAISHETKIKISLLEALERDDVSQWPEGIFRRAYVRAYARAVGLDPETTVREFLEVHPDPIVVPAENGTELENPQWPAGFRRVVTSAMAAVPSRRRRSESLAVDPSPVDDAPVRSETAAHAVVPEPPREPIPEPRREPSLADAAGLCTRLGQARDTREVAPVLKDALEALDAVGLIVWLWDSRIGALRPSIASGYADSLLAQLPLVAPDEENAIAGAFRSSRPCVVNGGAELTGAIAVPLLAHGGCAGVLAIELRHGDEQREPVVAFVAILAAQLVTLAGPQPLVEAVNACA